MLKKISVDLDRSIFLNADYSVHSGSCIAHQVEELKDLHDQYGGFPTTYGIDNTLIRQLWWTDEQLNFDSIGKQIGMEVITVSSILQPPGNIIPLHRDTFYQINKRFPNDKRQKARANIYLEDWKMGHIVQYNHDDRWITDTGWKAGNGLLWDSAVLHVGANIGFENKITLQVSGFIND